MKTAEFLLKRPYYFIDLCYPLGRKICWFCPRQLSKKFNIKLKPGEKQKVKIGIEKVGKPIKG